MLHTSESLLVERFAKSGLTLAFAESCTGGMLANSVTNVSGASRIFLGSIVAYDNSIKQSCLQVDPKIFQEFGAVSEPCAVAMVKGLQKLTQAHVCVATTGIAGPTGGTPEKPVGTVFVAYLKNSHVECQKYFFPFGRESFKEHVASTVFKKLLELV